MLTWEVLKVYLLTNLLPAIITVTLGVLVIDLVMKLVKKALERSKMEKAAHSLIASAVRTLLYVLLAFIAAPKLGLDVTSLVALASVLTLAVSLSIQNLLGNIFGGFTLLYTKPFKTGDFVELGGQSGTVREIGLTYTKLATPDNKEVSIPNSAVAAAEIVNYSATGKRRVDFTVSASYNAPVEGVLEALKEAADMPLVLGEPGLTVGVKEYGDSAISYALMAWVETADYWTAFFEINRRIKAVFDEKGIEMTYPHLNVHLDK